MISFCRRLFIIRGKVLIRGYADLRAPLPNLLEAILMSKTTSSIVWFGYCGAGLEFPII